MSGVTGLFLVDGGRVYDEQDPTTINRFSWYRTQLLPSFGLVLQGLEDRLSASGYNYFVNCVRHNLTGYVFEDRTAAYVPRGVLNEISGDTTPVLIVNFVTGDFDVVDDYRMQYRAEQVADATRKEYFPIIDIGILPEV